MAGRREGYKRDKSRQTGFNVGHAILVLTCGVIRNVESVNGEGIQIFYQVADDGYCRGRSVQRALSAMDWTG